VREERLLRGIVGRIAMCAWGRMVWFTCWQMIPKALCWDWSL